MLLIFSTPVFIRHLLQPKTVVFMHRCLIHVVLLLEQQHTLGPFTHCDFIKNFSIFFKTPMPAAATAFVFV